MLIVGGVGTHVTEWETWSFDARDPTGVGPATEALLAIHGVRPNPGVGPLQIVLTLPVAGAARLDVLDVAGRRRTTRDVGDLGAGRHFVRLPETAGLAPGVYIVRLSQGGKSVSERAAVLR